MFVTPKHSLFGHIKYNPNFNSVELGMNWRLDCIYRGKNAASVSSRPAEVIWYVLRHTWCPHVTRGSRFSLYLTRLPLLARAGSPRRRWDPSGIALRSRSSRLRCYAIAPPSLPLDQSGSTVDPLFARLKWERPCGLSAHSAPSDRSIDRLSGRTRDRGAFECRYQYSGGNHRIFVARVINVKFSPPPPVHDCYYDLTDVFESHVISMF